MDDRKIRSYTKENALDERNALAEEVKQKRKEHFDNKKSIHELLKDLNFKVNERSVKLEQLHEEIENISTVLNEISSSTISKILKIIKINKLKKELTAKKITLENINEEYLDFSIAINQLYEQSKAVDELYEVKDKISKFYADKGRELEKFEEDKKVRDVVNICKKYDAVFIHGVSPDFIPSTNSLLHGDVDWKTKIDILLAFKPTLATSTITKGQGLDTMWSSVGVVLKSGSVKHAQLGDAGTVAEGINKRTSKWSLATGNIKNDIENAVTKERKGHHNELIVENPGIAGFYCCVDGLATDELTEFNKEVSYINELGLPLYVFKDGELYEGVQEETNYGAVKISLGEKINNNELIDSKYEVSEEVKNKAIGNIFEKSPFKLSSPEIHCLESLRYGESYYVDLFAREQLVQKGFIDYNLPQEEFINVSFKILYKVQDGILLKGRLIRDKRNTCYWDEIREVKDSVQLTDYSNIQLDRNVTSFQDYLQGMEKYIATVKEKISVIEIEKNIKLKWNLDFWNKVLDLIAYHLHGFARQADKYNNHDVARKATEIANQILPNKDRDELIERRIDKNGNFVWTIDDVAQ